MRRELRLAEARARAAVGRGARQARHRGRQGRGERAALRRSASRRRPSATAKLPPMPFKVLNAPPPEADKFAADSAAAAPIPWRKILDTAPKAEAPAKTKAAAGSPPAASKTTSRGRPRRSRSSRWPLPPAPPSRWSRPPRRRGRPEVPRVDRQLRRAEGADHPLGDRQGGQLHGAGRQRGRREARGGRLHLRLRQGRAPSPASSAARPWRSTRPSSSAPKARAAGVSDRVPMPIRPTRKALLIGALLAAIGRRRAARHRRAGRRCPRSAWLPGRRCRPASRPAA